MIVFRQQDSVLRNSGSVFPEKAVPVRSTALRNHPDLFVRVISHIVSLQASPSILETLTTAKPRQIQGKECVKVIIDFTVEGYLVEEFDPLLSSKHLLPA